MAKKIEKKNEEKLKLFLQKQKENDAKPNGSKTSKHCTKS